MIYAAFPIMIDSFVATKSTKTPQKKTFGSALNFLDQVTLQKKFQAIKLYTGSLQLTVSLYLSYFNCETIEWHFNRHSSCVHGQNVPCGKAKFTKLCVWI